MVCGMFIYFFGWGCQVELQNDTIISYIFFAARVLKLLIE